MPDNMPQFRSKDGCVYIFNQAEKAWYTFCPAQKLPLDVKAQIRELKEMADALRDA